MELNIYFVPTDPEMSGADVENRYVELVAKVKESVTIPLAVKLCSQFSSIPNFAKRLSDTGVDGFRLDAVKHIEKSWLIDLRARLIQEGLPSSGGPLIAK